MRHLLFLLLCSLFCSLTEAQQIRYLDPVIKTVTESTATYADDLQLDLYLPDADTLAKRPVILYVHGGGFSGGARNDDGIGTFCRKLAKRGYVAISMSYRLTMKKAGFGCDVPAADKIQTFKKAGEDISRAVAYLQQNAQQYGIDMDRIVLAGSSAGAEAVIHAAYWKDTYIYEGDQILPKTFHYAGVISMAGALKDVNMITADNAIPTQLFHGTCDNLVPYAMAPHHYCPSDSPGYLLLYGGGSIADRLDQLDKSYYLVTACGGGHEWAGKPMSANFNDITDFLYYDVMLHKDRKTNRTILAAHDCNQMPGVPVCR